MMALACILAFSTLLVWLFILFNMNVACNTLVQLEPYHSALLHLALFNERRVKLNVACHPELLRFV